MMMMMIPCGSGGEKRDRQSLDLSPPDIQVVSGYQVAKAIMIVPRQQEQSFLRVPCALQEEE